LKKILPRWRRPHVHGDVMRPTDKRAASLDQHTIFMTVIPPKGGTHSTGGSLSRHVSIMTSTESE
jgi:hypothetical protein